MIFQLRAKLEFYEQACAVDSVTRKCAGSPTECRKAILLILGTDLRTSCACKGTDIGELYNCLGWQRLLWVNSCVGELIDTGESQTFLTDLFTVESQKHFHTKKSADHNRISHAIIRTTPSTTTSTTTTTTQKTTTTLIAITEAPLKVSTELLPPPQAFVPTSTTTTTTLSTTTKKRMTTKRTRATTTTTTAPPSK